MGQYVCLRDCGIGSFEVLPEVPLRRPGNPTKILSVGMLLKAFHNGAFVEAARGGLITDTSVNLPPKRLPANHPPQAATSCAAVS